MSHGYDLMYSDILDQNIKSILEIGIKKGASLAAWRDLYPHIDLYGIDITDKEQIKENIEYAGAITTIKDSTEKGIEDYFKKVDLIIDDGSHIPEDQIKTFQNFKDKFRKCYVIEDVVHKLYDVITAVKNEGFEHFSIYKSRDMRYKHKVLNSLYRQHKIDFKIEKEIEDRPLHIHSIVIYR